MERKGFHFFHRKYRVSVKQEGRVVSWSISKNGPKALSDTAHIFYADTGQGGVFGPFFDLDFSNLQIIEKSCITQRAQ